MVEFEYAKGKAFEEPHEATDFIMPSYPGLGNIESGIWEDFLFSTDLEFIRVMHNVHVGVGGEVGETAPEEVRKMWKAKTMLRIDAVAELVDHWRIFEVKPRFGRSALGQLLSYAYWFSRQKNPTKPAKLGAVVRRKDPNMMEIAAERGVKVFQV